MRLYNNPDEEERDSNGFPSVAFSRLVVVLSLNKIWGSYRDAQAHAFVRARSFKRWKMKSDKLMEYVTRFRENHIMFELEFIAFSGHVHSQACVLKLLKNLFSRIIFFCERRRSWRKRATAEKADFHSHFICCVCLGHAPVVYSWFNEYIFKCLWFFGAQCVRG